MKPIPVLGIPHFNRPDLLARCIASIDYPVETLVIIQNGPQVQMPAVAELVLIRNEEWSARGVGPMVRNLHIIKHPNAGCAGAWNEIIKLFPADWWLITNNDIQFAPGDLEKMALFMEQGGDDRRDACPTLAMAYGNHGASWFGVTAWGIQRVGLFDENIYPAYLEDCDWAWRAKLAGVRCEDVPDVHAIHGDASQGITGSSTIMSDPELRVKNGRTHGGNFEYYRAKWGGINGQEVYQWPFGMVGVPVQYWTFDPVRRARQQW